MKGWERSSELVKMVFRFAIYGDLIKETAHISSINDWAKRCLEQAAYRNTQICPEVLKLSCNESRDFAYLVKSEFSSGQPTLLFMLDGYGRVCIANKEVVLGEALDMMNLVFAIGNSSDLSFSILPRSEASFEEQAALNEWLGGEQFSPKNMTERGWRIRVSPNFANVYVFQRYVDDVVAYSRTVVLVDGKIIGMDMEVMQ